MDLEYTKVDLQSTAKRLGLSEDILKTLVKSFLESDMFIKAEEAFNKHDIEAAKIAIHSIKGTSINLGLVGMNKLALDIETKIKEQSYLDFDLLNLLREVWENTEI